MAYGQQELSWSEKLSGSLAMDSDRVLIIRKSYLLLFLAVAGMAVGGYTGINSPVILNLFRGWMGWILAMLALNAVPILAMKFQDNPTMGTLMLFLNGFIAGVVLSPMLYVAQMMSGYQIVSSAGLITLFVFISVTVYVFVSGTRWQPSRALWFGIFAGIMGAIVLNMFMALSIIGTLIAVGIGVMGVIALVSSTSEVIHNSELRSPVPSALMLFSGVFMIFQSVLYLLMSFAGGRRD